MGTPNFNSFLERLSVEGRITSQKELASILGIDSSAISKAKKRDSVPHSWITKLAKQFNLNPEWMESGTGKTHLKSPEQIEAEFCIIPKVKARLSAGGGSFETESDIEGYYSFKKEWLLKKGNPLKMVLMDIFGNSMEPELRDGDTVLVDLSKNEILAGAMYAIGVDDTVRVKRVEKLPDTLVLISENNRYRPEYIKGEEINNVRILGKVIWICREIK
jgi:phage repressor protein C with HTH and peptisase S24 domain